ncbi:ribokinase [Cellulomonas triticagri]|uniref:Ribokinase n=1 Tax=Cellulomonas triticagri TaxID=2483352 RepID=A0A3M2JKG6_9CELL|nr:ribokinase [Cellulomonas triticagri]RMI12706.1 ribokinase [Cellulomonas triticagri]
MTEQPAPLTGVVVVGSVNADLVARVERHPAPGETLLGTSMVVLPGGKGANQAVAAARRGAPTAMVGAVGSDAFAEPALVGLRAAGVDLGAVVVHDGPTGIAVVTVAADGENTIVVVPGANARLDATAVTAYDERVAGAAVVVVQGEIPRSGTERAAALTRGRLLVNLAPVVPVDPAVLRAADPLVVNEHEAALVLTSLDGGAPTTLRSPADEDRVASRLLAHGVPSVVLTLGARGALVARAGHAPVRITAPRVRVVDTTGAGDAFVGALAAGLAAGDDLVAAAHVAVRVGTFAVGRDGAQPSYPGLDDPLPPDAEEHP